VFYGFGNEKNRGQEMKTDYKLECIWHIMVITIIGLLFNIFALGILILLK